MRPSWLVAIFLALLGLAPLLLSEFAITLANYIGLYSLVALGLVLLPVGAQARLVEGVLEITALRRPPRRCGPFAAITLGHVVVAT